MFALATYLKFNSRSAILSSLLAVIGCWGSANAAAQVTFSNASLSFGAQAVTTSSASQSVTMTNKGTAAVTVTSIKVTGTNASSFGSTNTCGTSLKAGATCTIKGDFAPTTTGALSAAITVTDSATGSPQSIALSGTGITLTTLTLPASGALPASTTKDAYSGSINASGGSGSGYVFTVNGTSIPLTGAAVPIADGISVSSTGTSSLHISGTPTSPETVTLTKVTVKDNVGHTAGPDTYTIAVKQGYPVTGQISLGNSCGTNGTLPSFSVSINTSPVQTTTTNSYGAYTFASVPNGTYTVTPSISGPSSVFSPAKESVVVNSGSVTAGNISATLGYTVSGTVSYSGTKTGRIYLTPSCGNAGTSIAKPGPFTIRGVWPGSYLLNSWMDNMGYGVQNASNPTGSTTDIVVSEASVSGVAVALHDPNTLSISTPLGLNGVNGFDGGALVSFDVLRSNGIEWPTSYTVEWSTSKTFTSVAGSKTFAAAGDNPWIVTGIANGSGYYFRARGAAGTGTSQWSSVVGPVTVGTPTGADTLSGKITFSQKATGPLYVGVYDQNTNKIYTDVVGSKTTPPTSPASYSVKVPSGSHYFFFAILDQNNDGLIDSGDITNVNGYNMIVPTLSVSGNTTRNLTLASGNSTAVLRTGNDYGLSEWGGSSHNYELDFDVNGVAKRPVAVVLASGPGVLAPKDIAWCYGCGYDPNSSFSFEFTNYSTVPTVGTAYGLQITYSDGTQETLSPKITALLPNAPASLSPEGPVSATNTKPALAWNYPANAGEYLYQMWFSDQNYETVWSIPSLDSRSNSFTSSIAPSIPWGTDPTAESGNTPTLASLTDGNVYHWEVVAYDANGNRAQNFVDYVPGFHPLSLPSANPSTLGPAYPGYSYSGKIGATGGYGGYTYAIGGIYNCYGCSGMSLGNGLYVSTAQGTLSIAGTPTANGKVSFEVYVRDQSSDSPVGPVTYTITITDPPVSLPASGNNPLGVPVAGLPYGGTINASGGVGGGNYSFKVNGVSIPTSMTYVSITGADGLKFANSGSNTLWVDGTPAAAGTFPIDVTVTDTVETSNTASVNYSLVISGEPNGANNAYAKGTYVCKTNGFKDGDGSAWANVSSVVLDGKGNIASGIFDNISSNKTVAYAGTISGTYSIGADNNGLVITKTDYTTGTTGTVTQTWMLALTHTGEPSSPAQEFRLVEADDVGPTPSGETATANCYLANTAAFVVGTISNHGFAFGEQGENNTGVPKEYAGRFTTSTATGTGASAKGTITSGYMDGMRADQTGDSGGAFTGTYTGPNSSGRFTLTFTPTGAKTSTTTAAYIIDAGRMFLLETAGDTGVLSGDLRTQQQATYTDTNLDGAAVLSAQGIEYSNNSVSGFDSSIYQVNANGEGTLTVNQSYDNVDGAFKAGKENKASLAVTFDSPYPGRATFSPGSDSAFLYFYNTDSAFFLDLNGDGNPNFLESGLLEPQTQKTFTDAALSGTYMLGDLPLQPGNNSVGQIDLASTGSVTADISKAGPSYFSFNQPESGMTYSWPTATYGGFTVNGSEACMVVTPSSLICMDDTSSSAKISILQK